MSGRLPRGQAVRAPGPAGQNGSPEAFLILLCNDKNRTRLGGWGEVEGCFKLEKKHGRENVLSVPSAMFLLWLERENRT